MNLLAVLAAAAVVILVATPGARGTTNMTAKFEPASFSDPITSNKYNSSTKFSPRGMGTLYYVTNYFIDLVVKKDLLPEGYMDDGHLHIEWENIQPLLQYHASVLAVIALGLLFTIAMPLAGLVLCCYRYCKSSQLPYTEKRRDGCRRLLFGTFLAAVATIILYGVVCAFVTNAHMENGIKTLPKKLNTVLDDSQLYFKNTKLEISTVLVTNYEELELSINKALNSCGKVLTYKLAETSNAVVLSNLTALVEDLPTIRRELNVTQALSRKLQKNGEQLHAELSLIRSDLEKMLAECQNEKFCEDALSSENVKNLDTTADFSKLPNITDSLHTLDDLLIGGIEENIKKGKENFEQVAEDINQSIEKNIPEIQNNMQKAGNAIKDKDEKISQLVDNINKKINENGRNAVKNTLQRTIDKYGNYRYYIDISVSSVLLIVLLSITLGLFYGFCGKRPDAVYGEDCCNKGTGANFLIVAVWVMFLFSAVIMIVTMAHFIVGVVLQRAGCDTLRNPGSSQMFEFIDERVNVSDLLSTNSSNVTLSSIVSSCHMNNSFFEVLGVLDTVNITEVKEVSEKYRIKEKILALKNSIIVSDTSFTILDDEAKKYLEELKNSPLSEINFTAFSSVMAEAIVAVNLTELANTLNTTADKLAEATGKGFDPVKVQKALRNDSSWLMILQETLVEPMTQQVKLLQKTTVSLEDHLKFNHSSLSDAVDSLLTEVEEAQKYLNTKGVQELQKLAEELINEIVKYIQVYEKRVVSFTVNDVGRCGPISTAYNASVVATCDEILKPFNGFWASIGWSLLLFIPAVIICLKLNTLYRKIDPYQGPQAESEYLYDAYADRDNIPLANGPDKKNHHRRYNETYDNSNGYMGDYSAHLGRGDRSRDRTTSGYSPDDLRFTDMAPKHWDYSNGAMPRYHSPPLSTEYERPPPYYYPGPGESNRR